MKQVDYSDFDISIEKFKKTIASSWKKGIVAKIVSTLLLFLLLPIVLMMLARIIYKKFESKPIIAKILTGAFIILIFLPLTVSWFNGLVSAFSKPKQENKQPNISQQTVKPTEVVATPTVVVTAEPTKEEIKTEILTSTVTPKSSNPEDLFSEIGKKYAGDNGRVSSIKKDDGEWIVTIVINNWPEIMGEFGAKTWGRNFIYDVYHSGIPIKMAGVTVNSPKSIDKYLRVFVGNNYAKKLSDDDWKYLLPTNFYRWVTDNETSREVTDKANEMVVESNFELF